MAVDQTGIGRDMKRFIRFIGIIAAFIVLLGGGLFVLREPSPAIGAPSLVAAVDRADLIVINKTDRQMTLTRNGETLGHYSIRLGSSPVGTKTREGDGKTPEGSYRINRRNANSRFHLSLGLDYPNKAQRQTARQQGVSPGGDIFIHGQPNKLKDLRLPPLPFDWTDGCIAVSNSEIEEIFSLVATGTQVIIRP